MNKKKYIISSRARKAMENELCRFPNLETGGVLLGYSDKEHGIQVLEVVDGGYQYVIREMHSFQYDNEYVIHLCEQIAELYTPALKVVGIWHKHNAQKEIPFSRADEDMHKQMLKLYDYPCISILYEKITSETESESSHAVRVFLLGHDAPTDISKKIELLETRLNYE